MQHTNYRTVMLPLEVFEALLVERGAVAIRARAS
jgi:hypothetical protein